MNYEYYFEEYALFFWGRHAVGRATRHAQHIKLFLQTDNIHDFVLWVSFKSIVFLALIQFEYVLAFPTHDFPDTFEYIMRTMQETDHITDFISIAEI